MTNTYFHRLHEFSPTRFWINNPTPNDTVLGIEAGAINCTTNPTYAHKQLTNEETRDATIRTIEEAINNTHSIDGAADYVQQRLCKKIMDIFLPLYNKNRGKEGFVSIQGNPHRDKDPDHIISEALEYRKLGENAIAKIPVTKSGLEAIETLVKEDVAIIGTEIMSIAQAVSLCELYNRVSAACGKTPPLFVTHITGIYDQYIGELVESENIQIPRDVEWYAGLTVVKELYRILKERNYPGTLLGGGARGFKHLTELIGYDMHVTINWRNFADKLLEEDRPIVNRLSCSTPPEVVEELREVIPDFKRAYDEDGLSVEEFQEFGPVDLFRSMFVDGWDGLLSEILKHQ